MIRSAGIVLVLVATAAVANAPNSSIRPVSRQDVFPPALPSFAPAQSIRPRLRPGVSATPAIRSSRTEAIDPLPKATVATAATGAMLTQRGDEGGSTAKSSTSSKNKVGKVCKDRKLRGTEVGSVPAKLSGCGINKGAIKLYSVSGVTLSSPAVMECDTARALKKWVEGGMSKSVKRYGGGVVELKVAAGYACRTRNNRKGAKISEHGKGRAIDISALKLKNGNTISVLNDWGRGKKGKMLKKMHKQACGPFGTVLGPEADRYHKDHFHFDIAKHRGGPYCR
ncbi:hypothetical protein PH7735_00501 [Shimia thalassica]|uniref:Extensin-like C-terminal domain-containing protein n=1 Tax=Shimia thalassica TaxID=1715693 RepID=A0A0P1IB37_9RHOB|nr:extensin family protein [Shimia thalassica]CUJ85490.1 hypothetical protein PH7735_00501 [Shimia thalassica]